MDADALTGSLPALVTPFTAEGGLHDEDLRTLIRRSLDDGATGVLVAGTTGEGSLLEPEQREQLVAIARSTLGAPGAGGALLLAGASAPTVAGLHADVARLGAIGADAVLVLAPSTYPLSADELVDLHLDVAERAEVPTLAYHIPQLTGSALTGPAVTRLAQHDNIIGLKDSSPDADRRATFVTAAQPHPFAVCTGDASTLVAALRAGVHASITAIANIRQRAVVAAHATVAAGDDAAADRRADELARAMAGITSTGFGLAATLKAALQLDGVVTERWCAPPLHSVPSPKLDRIRTALLR
jgi:4-hydroxy-tetrahydrodipicolinate synthase